LRARGTALVWDLGCNTGRYARLAARHARYVVAVDGDPLAVDRLYRALAEARSEPVLPLVATLHDLGAAGGWRGRERRPLVERARPDLVLCLALVHHAVVGGGVPLDEFVDWLASLGGDLVVEFVDRDDPMVRALLARKAEPYDDYRLDHFERCLAARFRVERRERLASGTRLLYEARARGR
jgi:SAM-dependent methyltransferase